MIREPGRVGDQHALMPMQRSEKMVIDLSARY